MYTNWNGELLPMTGCTILKGKNDYTKPKFKKVEGGHLEQRHFSIAYLQESHGPGKVVAVRC